MQAVVAHRWGGPEVLVVEEVPDPNPGPGEAIVELRASGVNRHDLLVREQGRGFPLPRILGMEGSGVRRDTGESVVICPTLGWDAEPEAPPADWSILGDETDGTYAELVRVPAVNLFPKPARLGWEEAAGLAVAGLTAHRALFTRGRLAAGETVVVLGAGSGVSTVAVALAAGAGARVFVTSSDRAKIDRSADLGAVSGVRYTDTGWVDELRSRMGGGADLVVDGVGRGVSDSVRLLRPGGRVVVFGATGGAAADLDVPALYFSQCDVLGTTLGNRAEMGALLRTVGDATWSPIVDAVLPLDRAADAHARLATGHHFGKLVLSTR